MSVESANYVDELNANNPTANGPRSQGDDHLRLIKTALKASLPVDLRDVSSASEGEILVINSSGRPENKPVGLTRIRDSSLQCNVDITFSGTSELEDSLGIWTSSPNPTRFTFAEAGGYNIHVGHGSWSGKSVGADLVTVSLYKNGSTYASERFLVYSASGNMPGSLFYVNAAAADYFEVYFGFTGVATSDTDLTFTNVDVNVWRGY